MPSISQADPIILWFRQDLRISDHAALNAASQSGAPVIPLFIYGEQTPGDWKPGGASRWWLEGSLAELDNALQTMQSRLILRRGRAQDVLASLVDETGAKEIYFTRRYEPENAAEEKIIAEHLTEKGIECRRFGGSLLFEPEAVKTKSGTPFRVFTPFYKACLAMESVRDPVPAPGKLTPPKTWPKSEQLNNWALRPTAPNWASGFKEHWQPGTTGAFSKLNDFVEDRLATYDKDRDRPDRKGTSALSPHLHYGEISPREIWHFIHQSTDTQENTRKGRTSYLRELVWREFSYHLLWHWPHITESSFNNKFADFPWREDQQAVEAWQSGKTGYPIVDAGMRQLWQTGWMHNRVRMIVASFLTKHLLIPWQEGARWFWDTLVDADLANNSASWQWVAGSGADASPYFRIFNPILQGQKFDPEGTYVRKWVPEIAELPDKHVHAPWESGVRIEGYPEPLVDHKWARQRALDAYAELKARKQS